MDAICRLPAPHLNARRFGARSLPALTDDALFETVGVRVAFTGREGGVSASPFASLNLGDHVGDDARAVDRNRALLLEALGADRLPLVVPSQVHGDAVVDVGDAAPEVVEAARAQARAGADAVAVAVPGVAALLCFADCLPVVIVSPTGRFAVVHAGWRGVVGGIATKVVRLMAERDAEEVGERAEGGFNVYVGPHICSRCFETGEDVRARFVERFGEAVCPDERHIDLFDALRRDLLDVGIVSERIVHASACTKCESEKYYSFRAEGGVCGRHGAVAFREV
ncbi:multicopper polyphenol oxidase [Gordonibacter sp. An230]|uniref:polyphenol oxidase family protein n=1 Tax=Gordonibacter sp. An230 TaxID=1965592 RepID=UPI000B38A659|nr:polyphenol oxidase family protein [Gordonibacter sp. An230]OUO90076.1 multicopper polyphenol oxidase [Gordonibacter sp. An230]